MRRSTDDGLFWERFTKAYPVKATALALVLVLVYAGCGGQQLVASSTLDYDSLPAKAPRPKTPAEKLHLAATQLGELLDIQHKRDLTGEQAEKARAAHARVTGELQSIERQFAADRAKLEKLGAKEALARLAKVESRTQRLQRSLTAALTRVPANGERVKSAGEAAKLLRALSPTKPAQPLSSDLSFGIKNGASRPVSLSAGITPAYNAPSPTEAGSGLPRGAEPEDLVETPETKVTPALHALAAQLDHDPVEIYEYVRNTIRYEPYYGIRKGADQTLAEKAGSDADQAALLIALLRDSGIHARFVQGVAELPADRAASWLGVDVAAGERLDSAPEILWSGGIPTTQIRSNGQLSKVRFDHVWVEAFVAGDAYRGVDEGMGEKAWLPLDPSIKESRFNRPDEDLGELLLPRATAWAKQVVDGSTVSAEDGVVMPPSPEVALGAKQLITDAKATIEERAGDGGTLSDVIGGREIAQVQLPYLAGTTPFKTLAVSGEFRAVPRGLHASVTFAISGADPLSADPDPDDVDGITYQANTSDLVNKRVTVTYVPATAEDAEIIDAYHGLLNGPAYASALIPVLRVDGRVVARGHRAVSTGYAQNFRITYRMPGFASDSVENPIYVGSVTSFALDLGGFSAKRLLERGRAWHDSPREVTSENVLTDGVVGELMSILGQTYFERNDQMNSLIAKAARVHQQRSLSGLVVATDVTPTYVASFPVGTRLTGMYIDVDQDAQAVIGLEDEDDAPSQYMRVSGATASSSEGTVLGQAFGGTGASTMKAIEVATAQGIPLYQLTQENAAALLPRLNVSHEARTEISQALAQPGVSVVVPRDEVTVGGWHGSGYIVARGDSTAYRIMGGASGGFFGDLENWLSVNYWAGAVGLDTLSDTLNCAGILWDVFNLSQGASIGGWAFVAFLLEKSAAPLVITPAGWTFFATLFCIYFFVSTFLAVYTILYTDDYERCLDDVIPDG